MSAIPSSVDLEVLLSELGVAVTEEVNDEIYAHCPGHEQRTGHIDHDASWSINNETGEHYCFSCGYGGNLLGLIARTFDWHTDEKITYGRHGQYYYAYDYAKAQKWLRRRGGESFDIVKSLKSTRETFVRATKKKAMDETRLALFVDPPELEMEYRAVSKESVRYYGVRWSKDDKAWVLPIRDPEKGKLWGWQLKGVDLFRNQPHGVPKSKTLFGYHKLDGETCILVESPLDAVRLHTLGFTGAVASYGALWSDEQMSLICAKADRLIVALDNPRVDKAGKKAALQVMGRDVTGERIPGGKDWTRRIDTAFFDYTTDHKDVGDMEAADVIKGLSHAKSAIRGAKAVL